MKTQLRHLVILLAFAGCLWRFGANNLTAQTLISGSITSTFNLSNSSYKLTGNVTLGSSAYFNVTGNNVTLDLNGYYIKGSGAIQDALCLIRVNKNNTLTIKDSRPNSGPTTGTVTTNDIWNIGSSPNDYGIKGGIICNARARAIVVENGGKLYIQGGTLAGNLTKDGGSGGAVYLSQNATCVMTGGSIEHNFAYGSGGGVYVEGSNVGTIENCYERGHRAEEALDIVDKYLDEAKLLSIKEVSILHGKGNGILRKLIREKLSLMHEVEHFCDASLETGGTGITRVYFR